MESDFSMIVHSLHRDLDGINIYPLGDLHIGSPDFDLAQWKRWKNMVLADQNGYVVLVGDLLDNALKNSKTNVYEATMSPFAQKQWLKGELGDIKERILGGVKGNHENRSVVESDDCPMYDVMSKLDLEHLYRKNMAFVKVSLGEKRADRQWTYVIVLGHGASKNKVTNFGYAIDGMDVLITGHTHTASVNFPSKIVVDPRNNLVSMSGYTQLVVPAFSAYGGYAMNAMYMPQDHRKIPVLSLSGVSKNVEVRWV